MPGAGVLGEPEAMFWEFEAATVLLPALSLGKDQGNKTSSVAAFQMCSLEESGLGRAKQERFV